jgi:hypothetical protein
MKSDTTAKQVITANIGAVQKLDILPGVTLDQDGNRYATAEAKYCFLRDCLAQGIRSGNLQPVTTVNQCRDLMARLNEAARACGKPELTVAEMDLQAAPYLESERLHERRLALYRKFEPAYIVRGSEAWARIYAMTPEAIEVKLASYEA